jgi:hypothetical protein
MAHIYILFAVQIVILFWWIEETPRPKLKIAGDPFDDIFVGNFEIILVIIERAA